MSRRDPVILDAIVLGAGGAGLFAAHVAGQGGASVLVLDHAPEPGRKIVISGGGRCNFTNTGTEPGRFLSANPHFAKSALSRYTPRDFIDLVERHSIAWHEKTLGQLFCDGSARQIVTMLMEECARGHVRVELSSPIEDVEHADGLFAVRSKGRTHRARALVIATGGPSIPKLGATGFAFDLARRFSLKVVEPRPALVPFTLPKEEAVFRELSGVATPALVRAGFATGTGKAAGARKAVGKAAAMFREAVLLTHKGLSGPAILQASSYWRHGESVGIDFLPDAEPGCLVALKAERPGAGLAQALSAYLPARLADALAERMGAGVGAGAASLRDTKDAALRAYEECLRDWRFTPNGTEGYAKAEVTVGGIATKELSSRTMEATRMPGLYAIGEGVDVTGWLGGYNFQWAWASGYAAGRAIAERGAGRA